MIYLIATLLAIYLIVVPTYLGKIIQDKYALFSKGFVPVLAIGFFVFVAFVQLVGIIMSFDTPNLNTIYIIGIIIGSTPIIVVAILYKYWYKSEWKINWSTLNVLVPILSVHIIVYHLFPWLSNNNISGQWLPTYLEDMSSSLEGTTEHFNLVLEPLVQLFDFDKTEFVMIALPVPIALLFGNVMNFLVDSLFNKWNGFIYWIGILSIIAADTLGFSLFSPQFLLLIALMFSIGIIILHDRGLHQRASLLMYASFVLIGSFGFSSMAVAMALVVTFGYGFYAISNDRPFIVKYWSSLSLGPMFLVSISFFWENRIHGVIMFIALLILYAVILMNLVRTYDNISKAERALVGNSKYILVACLILAGFSESLIILADWSKFSILSFMENKNAGVSSIITNVSIYLLGLMWCLWYIVYEKNKNSIQSLLLSISLMGLMIISPLMTNTIQAIFGFSILKEIYIIVAFSIITNLLFMLNKYNKLRWTLSTFLPYASIFFAYWYVIIKK